MKQRARGRRRRISKARQKRRLLISAMIAVVIAVVVLIAYFMMRSAVNKVAEDKIWDHVYIENLNVAGMTAKEAGEALEAKIAEYRTGTVTLIAEEAQAEATLEELGFGAENLNKLVKKAVSVGKEGSVWSRYRTMKDMEDEEVRFDLIYTIDKEMTKSVISEKIPHLENEAKDATIKRENGVFVITDGQTGKKIDLDASADIVGDYFSGSWEPKEDETIELITVLDEPDVTREHLEQIQDKLGTFSTSFTRSSNRGKNIANAASRINGIVLLPGEEFSASDAMGARTEENGYLEAGAYLDGQTVQSLGGGVCQVSTTLYNAVLLAELEVTERYAHSMLVDYVEPSMDAAIAEGYKDFKFKNNSDTPVYIEGYTSGGELTFTIYGKETRTEGREVSYVSDVLSRTEHGKKFVASGDKVGTLKKSVSGHTGMKTKLWKVITENGVEVSREAVNTSSYMASDATYNVGTATDNAEAKELITKAIKTQDEAKINAAIAQAKDLIAAAQHTEETVAPTTPETTLPETTEGEIGSDILEDTAD